MSSAKLKRKIWDLQQQGRQLLEALLAIEPLLRGCLTQVFTRCGKPNCWCAQCPKAHPHVRLTWSENGRLTTRKVPPQAIPRVRELTGNYRAFRSLHRKRLKLQAQMEDLLDRYEASLIAQAQGPLRSLGFTSTMSARSTPGRQKAP